MPRLKPAQLERVASAYKIYKPVNGERFGIEVTQSPYKAAKIQDGRVTLFHVDNEGKETPRGVVFNAAQRAIFQSRIKS